jgi:putative restriction endonuclease
VANTDRAWFDHFRPRDELARVDEVNFWRPLAQSEFRALQPGEPLFFRLKEPDAAVVGFGFFAVYARTSVSQAWELFGDKNGDPTRERFLQRIAGYRRSANPLNDPSAAQLSCIVLRDALFLASRDWLRWGPDLGWQRNIVAFKGYDLTDGPGRLLKELLQRAHPEDVPDLVPTFAVSISDERLRKEREAVVREGQGTFRLRLLRAYRNQCAVTGEHATPVLDAAHITPYLGPRDNHVQNGLILRTDLHRLYDDGYVTVTPDLKLEVSPRLKEEFENGRSYYEMAGRSIVLPKRANEQPSRQALLWHADHIFR